MSELLTKHCRTSGNGTVALDAGQVADLLKQVLGWSFVGGHIEKTFAFKNYYETMAFVNATAFISHREDHHPDLEVGYDKCKVKYSTHAVNGLSDNDFICAARMDALFDRD